MAIRHIPILAARTETTSSSACWTITSAAKEKKINLDDDFIKFLRWAQWRIAETGQGVIGYITNNVYLDGLTHRRMRESLLETFDEIYVLNLHGSAKKQETTPDGAKDDNVFDIPWAWPLCCL